MYKVFIYDKPLIFCDLKEDLSSLEKIQLLSLNEDLDLFEMLKTIKLEHRINYVIRSKNPKKSFISFFLDHLLVKAAGGLVLNAAGKILFIYRNGIWDLPKGKVESGESIDCAAIREVEEECGIVSPVIDFQLKPSYHTYVNSGRKILKCTYWYVMKYSGDEMLIPQEEEGITQVKWVELKDLDIYLKNSFGSIQGVVNEYLDKI